MMSLMPGRGETREVRIAAKFILDDMESFSKALSSIMECDMEDTSVKQGL